MRDVVVRNGRRLELIEVEPGPADGGGLESLRLRTDGGIVEAAYHPATTGDAAVVWLGGAGGGLLGPAAGLYPRLANRLVGDSIASLRLHYRFPSHLEACILDALAGVDFLAARGRSRVAFVGHSFGGAVALEAAAESPAVVGVATLASQTFGAARVAELSPRPLIFFHGDEDGVLPELCARNLHQRAGEPKQLVIYPGAGHMLDEVRDELDRDLHAWLRDALRAG